VINALDVYRESGLRAAIAFHQHDLTRCQFEFSWMARAARLEAPLDRRRAREAFAEAYRAEHHKRRNGG
jgi:hypothetical protein